MSSPERYAGLESGAKGSPGAAGRGQKRRWCELKNAWFFSFTPIFSRQTANRGNRLHTRNCRYWHRIFFIFNHFNPVYTSGIVF